MSPFFHAKIIIDTNRAWKSPRMLRPDSSQRDRAEERGNPSTGKPPDRKETSDDVKRVVRSDKDTHQRLTQTSQPFHFNFIALNTLPNAFAERMETRGEIQAGNIVYVGWGTRIRTSVDGVRVRSPAARRSPKIGKTVSRKRRVVKSS